MRRGTSAVRVLYRVSPTIKIIRDVVSGVYDEMQHVSSGDPRWMG